MIEWAAKTGPFTGRLVAAMLAEKPHPEMGYRAALGVISLSRKYGPERVEAACTRAVRMKDPSLSECEVDPGIRSGPASRCRNWSRGLAVEHANIRGAEYYGDSAKPAKEVGGC